MSIRITAFVMGVAVLLLRAGAVQGQAGLTDQPRPGDKPLEVPEFLPEKPPALLDLPPVPPPREDVPLRRDLRFVLRAVDLKGSTVLDQDDLSTIVEPYLGRQVGIEELLDIRRRVTLLYVNRGYINSGAVLPDQEIENGRVTLVAVEGGLTDVVITGNRQFDEGFIRSRLGRGLDRPLNISELRDNTLILLQHPGIKRLDAELGPGARPGESELTVEVEEDKRFDIQASFANDRPPSVGPYEGEFDFLVRNLSGWGDETNLQIAGTEGLRDYFADFSIPVTAYDTTLSLSAERSESEVVEEPFNAIDVESESESFEIGLRQPLWRTPSRELAAGVTFARRRSQTFLLGEPFAFSEGVEDDGESTVAVTRFVLEYVDRGANQVIALRSTFSLGWDLLGATINSGNTADGEFFAWLGQLQWIRRLGFADSRVVFRADAQLTPDRLLPLEKFDVGGVDSVRGYRENRFVRDNGAALSLEFRVPIFHAPVHLTEDDTADGAVELAPFFDYGRTWDNGPNGRTDDIYSVGIGLRWAPSDKLRLSIYYGEDLREVAAVGEDDDLQDFGLHFNVTLDLY